MKFTKLVCVLTVGALSACGSSSDVAEMDQQDGGPLDIVAGPGAGGGTISNQTVASLITSVDAVDTAVADGDLVAATLPASGTTTMTGFIGTEGGTDDDAIVGNLTIEVTHATNAVTANASDLTLYDVSDAANPTTVSTFGGTLSGTGTVTGTSLTSSLDGTLTSQDGALLIDSDLSGDLLDNDGDIISAGEVTGTVNGEAGSIDGDFIVSE